MLVTRRKHAGNIGSLPFGRVTVGLDTALALFWHPVATVDQLRGALPGGRGPLAVRLLGRDLLVADLDGPGLVVVDATGCPRPRRRGPRTLDDVARRAIASRRCSYYGLCFGDHDACGGGRATIHGAALAHGLVWARLDNRPGDAIEVPAGPFGARPAGVLSGHEWSWPIGASQWVEAAAGCPPEVVTVSLGLPTSVEVTDGTATAWALASPIEAGACRTYWLAGDDSGGRLAALVDAEVHAALPLGHRAPAPPAVAYRARVDGLTVAAGHGLDALVAALR